MLDPTKLRAVQCVFSRSQ